MFLTTPSPPLQILTSPLMKILTVPMLWPIPRGLLARCSAQFSLIMFSQILSVLLDAVLGSFQLLRLEDWGQNDWERHLISGVSTQVWPLELSVNLLDAFALDVCVESRLEGRAELLVDCVEERPNVAVPVVHPFEKAPQVSCLLMEGKCSG